MKEKILIVEDEEELALATKAILEFNSYDVTIVNNGKAALDIVKKNYYDVIIMDIMMPIMNGLDALKEMRKIGIDYPVLMLTAKSQINDKIEGLDLGANDYLTKPFNKKELLARIRVLIRNNNNQIIQIGNLTMSKENLTISTKKASFHLNINEYELLSLLVKNTNKKISNSIIFNEIWKKDEISDSTIKMYIAFISEKLKAMGANLIIKESNGYILEIL